MEILLNTLMIVFSTAFYVVLMPGRAAWELMLTGSGPNILLGIVIIGGMYGGIPIALAGIVRRYF